MDNNFSQPALDIPVIPDDFEAQAGSTRKEFAEALRRLFSGTKVTGITEPTPTPYDLTVLTQKVEALEAVKVPKMRSILKDGVSNDTLLVAFEDIGTADYFVNVVCVTPDADINTVTWSVVTNSQKTNEVKIRIDGTGATYKFLVNIIEKV